MTFYEKMRAIEQKREMILEQGCRCLYCGEIFSNNCLPQFAHKLINSKGNLKKYGAEIIHHKINGVITCPDCNSKAIINNSKTELVKKHVNKIEKSIQEENSVR